MLSGTIWKSNSQKKVLKNLFSKFWLQNLMPTFEVFFQGMSKSYKKRARPLDSFEIEKQPIFLIQFLSTLEILLMPIES